MFLLHLCPSAWALLRESPIEPDQLFYLPFEEVGFAGVDCCRDGPNADAAFPPFLLFLALLCTIRLLPAAAGAQFFEKGLPREGQPRRFHVCTVRRDPLRRLHLPRRGFEGQPAVGMVCEAEAQASLVCGRGLHRRRQLLGVEVLSGAHIARELRLRAPDSIHRCLRDRLLFSLPSTFVSLITHFVFGREQLLSRLQLKQGSAALRIQDQLRMGVRILHPICDEGGLVKPRVETVRRYGPVAAPRSAALAVEVVLGLSEVVDHLHEGALRHRDGEQVRNGFPCVLVRHLVLQAQDSLPQPLASVGHAGKLPLGPSESNLITLADGLDARIVSRHLLAPGCFRLCAQLS